MAEPDLTLVEVTKCALHHWIPSSPVYNIHLSICAVHEWKKNPSTSLAGDRANSKCDCV